MEPVATGPNGQRAPCENDNLKRHMLVKLFINAGAVLNTTGKCRTQLSSLPGEALENEPVRIIEDLARKRVLKRFDGDSGEALWALDLSFVRLGLQFIGLEPLVDSKCDRGCNSLSDLCKAELVIKLLRLGWVKVAAKPDPYKADGLKQL